MKKLFQVNGHIIVKDRKNNLKTVYSFTSLFTGRIGAKTAMSIFETEKRKMEFTISNIKKGESVHGFRLQYGTPHFAENGQITHWNDKVLAEFKSDNY